MPRTCTLTERATMAAAGVNHLLKLQVADADGTMQDCSALGTLGLDLLDGAMWGETLDAPVSTGTLTIRRDTNDDTAAPTMGASSINRNAAHAYAALFEKGRAVLVSTAVVAPGASPSGSDWKPMFTGRIDAVHWQANPMTIDISDIGAWVVDAFIQQPKQYITAAAPGAGPLLGVVLQSMVNDTVNAPVKTAPITIYQPLTAAFQPYAKDPQQPGSLFAAMRGLAQEIGWELRYRYDSSDVFRLTLYEPDRANTTPDWTVGPSEYQNVTKLETSIADIRNYIQGWYNVAAVSRGSVVSQDATSIAKYGLRFMQVSSVFITSSTDMQALTDAIKSDLSEAPTDQEIEMSYFWPVQIGDLITFQANGDHYDSDQTLAVVGYTHTFANGEGTTTIQARGKVAGAYRTWFRRSTSGPEDNPAQIALNNLRWTDSSDGTTRTFAWDRGSDVDVIFVFDELEAAPPLADPWPADGQVPNAILATGTDTYTVTKPPAGFQRFVQLEPRLTTMTDGPVRRIVVDPAPSALAAKISAAVTDATADLTVGVTGGVSDWPVTVDVFEDDPGAAAIATTSLSANTTLTKLSTGMSALGARSLPQREARRWWVRLTNVAGQTTWDSTAADRDALPAGTVTPNDYRATPKLVCAYDDDTDTITITLANGATKVFSSGGGGLTPGGGTITYTVGDAVTTGSIEGAFVVDELRNGYSVSFTGGGQALVVWSGSLHGQPSNPPTLKPRVVVSANVDAADVYAVVGTSVVEKVRVFFRDAEDGAAPVYGLCVGAGDSTPLYVDSGTEVGPSNFFVASGSPAAKLSGISLTRDQVKRVYLQAVGKDSGVASPWIPVTLSLKEQPWLESVSLSYNVNTGNLEFAIKGGAHCASVFYEFSADSAFSSPTTGSASLADGGSTMPTRSIAGSDTGKTWYARATPYSAVSLGGLAGVPQISQCDVSPSPSLTVTPTPSTSSYSIGWSGTGTITLSIDGGSYSTPSASPIAVTRDSNDHTYAFKSVLAGQTIIDTVTVPCLEKDTVTPDLSVTVGTVTSTTVPLTASFTNPGGGSAPTCTVQCYKCTMVISGTTYNEASGAISISSGTVVTVNRPSSTQVEQGTVKFRASISSGGAEEIIRTVTPQLNVGPSLSVNATPGSSSYSITWSGVGTITDSIDGGSFSTPSSSPITVTRDGNDHSYTFKAVADGQEIRQTIIIPATAGAGGGTAITTPSVSVASEVSDTLNASFSISGAYDHYHVQWYRNDLGSWNAVTANTATFGVPPTDIATGGGIFRTFQIYVEAHDPQHNVIAASLITTVIIECAADH